MNDVFQILTFALIPAVVMGLAGVWAVWRPPGKNWRSALMHFAAGVVFAVVAVELLPDLVHEQSVLATVVGFSLGTVAMLGVRMWNERSTGKASETSKSSSTTLIVATAVDLSVDGLMLGVGFSVGQKQSFLLTIALALELVTLGLAMVSELQQGNLSRWPILMRIGLLAGTFVLSAVIGSVAISLISGLIFVGVIAFGAAALLFLVTEELLTEAHQVEENPLLTSAFFIGFLGLFLLELLG